MNKRPDASGACSGQPNLSGIQVGECTLCLEGGLKCIHVMRTFPGMLQTHAAHHLLLSTCLWASEHHLWASLSSAYHTVASGVSNAKFHCFTIEHTSIPQVPSQYELVLAAKSVAGGRPADLL